MEAKINSKVIEGKSYIPYEYKDLQKTFKHDEHTGYIIGNKIKIHSHTSDPNHGYYD